VRQYLVEANTHPALPRGKLSAPERAWERGCDGAIPGQPTQALALYKIFFYLFLCVQESTIPLVPPPIYITHTTAILMRNVCAIYDPPPEPPYWCDTPYNIGNDNIV